MHSQFSDGVFEQLPGDILKFHRVAAPTLEEINHITKRIAKRVHRYLERRYNDLDHDALLSTEPMLAKCYEASIRYLSALGTNAGKPLLRIISQHQTDSDNRCERTIAGFNLHASIAIEGHDRKALERILRYMGRPPLSSDRLSLAPDGHRLIVTLKTPGRDGTSQIILTPFELLERLVAIIPLPRKNLIRYHGCFGPNSKIRGRIVKSTVNTGLQQPKGNRITRINFARLMSRIFEIDVLACPKCQGKLKVISFIVDDKPIREILKSLKMPTAPPDNQAESDRYVEYDYHHMAGQNYQNDE